MKLSEWIATNDVTMHAEPAEHPSDATEWQRKAYAWECTLHYGVRDMSVMFYMGAALTGEPTIEDVLDSIASDTAGYENSRDIDDWAAEYGIEKISEAVSTYRAVEQQAAKLRDFLGQGTTAYDTLLWDTERL